VAGDWNGNGTDTVGLYVPATGRWYLNNKTDGSIDDMITFRSLATPPRALPIAGDWDGARIGVALATESKPSVLTAGDSGEVTRPLSGESEFRNQPDTLLVDTLDVNQDGFVTPLDVLAVVNALNRAVHTPLADLDGSGVVTPADVLRLIHVVNAMENGSVNEGEGEPVPAPDAGPAAEILAAGLPSAGFLASGESPIQNPAVPVEQDALLGRERQASQRGASVPDDELVDIAEKWLDEILDQLAAGWQ
jgi:hypothetical protein